jgi:CRP-like cAMP-binding protein
VCAREHFWAGAGFVGVDLPARHSAWIARCVGRGELAPLNPDDVAELAALLAERAYPAGAVLFRVGELPARVHIVRVGAVELSRQVGGRRVVLQVLRAGDVFGDVPLLVRMTEPFDARALEDSVVLSADSVALFRLLERRPRLAQRWLVSLASRMAATQARLVDLLAGGLDAQVASVLTREAEQGVVHLAQSVIAELLGARRTSVNRILKRFEARGLVRVGYGQVEVVDPAGLLMTAGGDTPSAVRVPVARR